MEIKHPRASLPGVSDQQKGSKRQVTCPHAPWFHGGSLFKSPACLPCLSVRIYVQICRHIPPSSSFKKVGPIETIHPPGSAAHFSHQPAERPRRPQKRGRSGGTTGLRVSDKQPYPRVLAYRYPFVQSIYRTTDREPQLVGFPYLIHTLGPTRSVMTQGSRTPNNNGQ